MSLDPRELRRRPYLRLNLETGASEAQDEGGLLPQLFKPVSMKNAAKVSAEDKKLKKLAKAKKKLINTRESVDKAADKDKTNHPTVDQLPDDAFVSQDLQNVQADQQGPSTSGIQNATASASTAGATKKGKRPATKTQANDGNEIDSSDDELASDLDEEERETTPFIMGKTSIDTDKQPASNLGASKGATGYKTKLPSTPDSSMDPNEACAEYVAEYEINKASEFVPGMTAEELAKQYRFAGRIVGMALFFRVAHPYFLCAPLLKLMAGKESKTLRELVGDLSTIDRSKARNYYNLIYNKPVPIADLEFEMQETFDFQQIDPNDDTKAIQHYITVQYEKVNDIPVPIVTDDQFKKFVRYSCLTQMYGNTAVQLQNFLVGVYEVVPRSWIGLFDERELDLIMCGITTINVDDWETNAVQVMRRGTRATNDAKLRRVKRWFWRAVRSMTNAERLRLYTFVTSEERPPPGGFADSLKGSFKVDYNARAASDVGRVKRLGPSNTPNWLPSASTCINKMNITAEYRSYKELKSALKYAIIQTGTDQYGIL